MSIRRGGAGGPAARRRPTLVSVGFTEREEHRLFLRRLAILFALVVAVTVLGTVGFALILRESPWNAFLRTVDVVGTVGSMPRPRGNADILWAALVFLGVGTVFYALITLIEFIVAGHLAGMLGVRRVTRHLQRISEHTIVCGFGRVGRQVSADLVAEGERIVVVDTEPEDPSRFPGLEDVTVITGSAADDHVLEEAGIRRARGLVACLDSDAMNVLVTLSARELNPEVHIVARSAEHASVRKLQRAGADSVVSPYELAGEAMARQVIGGREPS